MKQTKHHTIDISSLGQFAARIGSHHRYLVQNFHDSLFHYTDLEALTGIIREHDLWLTNSRFSNDEQEWQYGYKLAKQVINRKIRKSRSKTKQAYLKQVANLVDAPPPAGVYICCFCERDNLLSQWRGYGQDGTGVSLAFNPADFQRYCGADMPPNVGLTRLWKVFYSRKVQEDIVEKALDLVPELNRGDSDKSKAQKTADAIHFFIPTFKNKDFSEEKERRLIFTPSLQYKTLPLCRVVRGMLIPYYTLKTLDRSNIHLPITNVTIGPSVRQRWNVEGAKLLLAKYGYEKVTVRPSNTPFRG